jgi:hypothetical protein
VLTGSRLEQQHAGKAAIAVPLDVLPVAPTDSNPRYRLESAKSDLFRLLSRSLNVG